MGSYNNEEFVPEVSTGGDDRCEGGASCGMRGSRLYGNVCCCELRRRRGVTESIVRFAGFMVYGEEKFEEKLQVVWSGSFWHKAR